MATFLTVDDVYVGEGDGVATLTFRLSEPAPSPMSVDFTAANGSAVRNGFAGADYQNFPTTTMLFATGEQVKTFDITLINDGTVEAIQNFYINLSNAVGLVPVDDFALVNIVDNDNGSRAPYVSVADTWVDETDGYATFEIVLDRVAGTSLTVNYATQNGTATGGDYTSTSGSVTFAPGQMVKTITVPINDDNTNERAEAFSFNLTGLSGVAGAQIADGNAMAYIAKSDGALLATPTVSVLDATVNEAAADGTIEIVLQLNAPSATQTSVNVSTNNDSAVRQGFAGADFYRFDTTVVFEPGETVRTISTPIINDATIEQIQHLIIGLDTPVGLNISKPVETISITDDDDGSSAPVVSVTDQEIDEKAGYGTFVIQLDHAASNPVSVDYETVARTATAGSDFLTTSGSVTFNPGQTSAQILVEITDDAVAEGAEVFEFNLTSVSGVAGATIGDGQALGTIALSDTPDAFTPNVTIEHTSFSEGKTDGMAQVTLKLDAPSSNSTSVDVTTSNGTAVRAGFAGADFATFNMTVNFDPGETVKTVEFRLVNDAAIEPHQAFYVGLSSPTGLNIPQSYATFGIFDDDNGDRAPSVSVLDRTVNEDDSFAYFDIVMDRFSPLPVTISYETANGSATDGADYTGEAASVTFNPQETVKTIAIPISDDGASENAETFFLNITGVAGFPGISVAKASGQVTIGESDTSPVATPTVSISNTTVQEGAFNSLAEVELVLNSPALNATSVALTTTNGTAVRSGFAGADFATFSTTVEFQPGETVKTIQFPIINDGAVEPTQEFTVNLSSPAGLLIGTPSATYTVLDDDPTTVSVAALDVAKDEGDSGVTAFDFVAFRAGDTTTAQTVDWTAEGFGGGFAPANSSDFDGAGFASGTISFAANETEKTFSVDIATDNVNEGTEAFAVRLSNPSTGLIVLDELASAAILDDDSFNEITGNNSAETLNGTSGDDDIDGQGGADIINGLDGNDILTGGGGNDTINGGDGADTMIGSNNDDVLTGGIGDDSMTGNSGKDTLDGGAGDDTIDSGGKADEISGGDGDDLINGGTGNDTITGGTGADTITGAADADWGRWQGYHRRRQRQ